MDKEKEQHFENLLEQHEERKARLLCTLKRKCEEALGESKSKQVMSQSEPDQISQFTDEQSLLDELQPQRETERIEQAKKMKEGALKQNGRTPVPVAKPVPQQDSDDNPAKDKKVQETNKKIKPSRNIALSGEGESSKKRTIQLPLRSTFLSNQVAQLEGRKQQKPEAEESKGGVDEYLKKLKGELKLLRCSDCGKDFAANWQAAVHVKKNKNGHLGNRKKKVNILKYREVETMGSQVNEYLFSENTEEEIKDLSRCAVELMRKKGTLLRLLKQLHEELKHVRKGSSADTQRMMETKVHNESVYGEKWKSITTMTEDMHDWISHPLTLCLIKHYPAYTKYEFECMPWLCDQIEEIYRRRLEKRASWLDSQAPSGNMLQRARKTLSKLKMETSDLMVREHGPDYPELLEYARYYKRAKLVGPAYKGWEMEYRRMSEIQRKQVEEQDT